MNRRREILLTAMVVLVAAGIGWLVLRPSPEPVSLEMAGRGHLAVTVEEEGHTRVRERYDVSAPVDGWSPRITLKAGDAVTAGQVLVALEPAPAAALDPRTRAEAQAAVKRARAALEAEQARLEATRATAEYARAEHQRLERLRIDDRVSRSDVERAAAEARRAEAEVASARYAVEVARQELAAAEARLQFAGRDETPDRISVTAPVDGRVLAVHHESQGVVRAGQPLLSIGNPESLEVVIEVLSADAVRIESGMPVRFHRWGGERPLEGHVRRVEPSGFTEISALGVEEQRVRVIADITAPFEQWQGLGDAYRVEAEFILWEDNHVLRIPETAVFRHDDGHAVFVAENGVARLREISIGRRGGLDVQVTDGLEPGEQVILQPGDTVEDGTRVTQLRPR